MRLLLRRTRWCDQVPYGLRGHVPGGHVGLLEGDVDVPAGRKKQWGVRQQAAYGECIDVGGQLVAGIESSDRSQFVRRSCSQRLAGSSTLGGSRVF
jgi:hypothetical protein